MSGSGISHVSDIGYYALGIFVGAVISFALVKVQDWTNPIAIVTGLIGAAVSGSIMVMLAKIGNPPQGGDAIALYPVGLANALAAWQVGSVKEALAAADAPSVPAAPQIRN